nr:SLC13 family permease [Oleiagrimonas sp. C23AA]
MVLTLAVGVYDPRPLSDWWRWAQPGSLASLLALLAVAQGVRLSGYVQAFARRMAARLSTQRAIAAVLVSLAALTSMLLTNDISLFLLVPLTLALADMVHLPRQRLVIFEALAVNTGSALSPVGNPQNLLLWKQSGLSMPGFVAAMAPAVALMALVLVLATWFAFPAKPLLRHEQAPAHEICRPRLGAISALALIAVLVLMECGLPYLAALLAVVLYLLLERRVLAQVDWALLATIAGMLLGLGHLAQVPMVTQALHRLDWSQALTTLLAGMGLSQVISNVPATVALKGVASHTLWLAVAVNVGGFGLVVGSLANFIALRLEGSRAVWWKFHLWSLPFLAVVGGGVVAFVCLRS